MSEKYIDDELLEQAGQVMLVQKHQEQDIEKQLSKIQVSLNNLSGINDDNLDNLDLLIMQAEALCQQQGLYINNYGSNTKEIVTLTEEEKLQIKVENLEMLSTVTINDNISWEEYISNIKKYAEKIILIFQRAI